MDPVAPLRAGAGRGHDRGRLLAAGPAPGEAGPQRPHHRAPGGARGPGRGDRRRRRPHRRSAPTSGSGGRPPPAPTTRRRRSWSATGASTRPPGSWVLTPLVLDDGTVLVVNRGWVPVTGEQVARPGGRAARRARSRSTGLLEESQSRGSFGPTDPSGEVLDTLSRVDIDRYQEQVDGDLYPVWLQLETQDPAAGRPPDAGRARPSSTEGPHLGLRRPVVHLHPHRPRRLPADPAPPGPPGRRPRRSPDPCPTTCSSHERPGAGAGGHAGLHRRRGA